MLKHLPFLLLSRGDRRGSRQGDSNSRSRHSQVRRQSFSIVSSASYVVPLMLSVANGILGLGEIVNLSMLNGSAAALPRQLCLLLVSGVLLGQSNLPIKFLGATPTQATFSYSAPDPSPCIVQVSTDPAFTTLDRDVDPACSLAATSTPGPGISSTAPIDRLSWVFGGPRRLRMETHIPALYRPQLHIF